jgi:hypothetical protein
MATSNNHLPSDKAAQTGWIFVDFQAICSQQTTVQYILRYIPTDLHCAYFYVSKLLEFMLPSSQTSHGIIVFGQTRSSS